MTINTRKAVKAISTPLSQIASVDSFPHRNSRLFPSIQSFGWFALIDQLIVRKRGMGTAGYGFGVAVARTNRLSSSEQRDGGEFPCDSLGK